MLWPENLIKGHRTWKRLTMTQGNGNWLNVKKI